MTLLDIGGGYPGENDELFDAMALDINKSLELHFPVDNSIKIIAEPGRFFPCSAVTLVTSVRAKRSIEQQDTKSFMYYINDSVYSTFSCILTDIPRFYTPILLVTQFFFLSF